MIKRLSGGLGRISPNAGVESWRRGLGVAAFVGSSVLATAASAATPPGETFDIIAMFASASLVVQAVMLMLVAASILIWTTLAVKTLEIRRAERQVISATEEVGDAESLTGLKRAGVADPIVATLLAEALDEYSRGGALLAGGRIEGLKERVAARLERVEEMFVDRLSHGVGHVASVASVSPYVGLFGTVWGIMHSFLGIAAAKSTNLAVVAPGIAEALLATGLGLVTAIPATLIFNSLVNRVARYRSRLGGCSTLLMCLVSRDADYSQLPQQPRASVTAL